MNGVICNMQRPTKDSRTLWDNVKSKHARIGILENITQNDRSCTSLSNFLRNKDRMRVGSNSDASFGSSSSDESSRKNSIHTTYEYGI